MEDDTHFLDLTIHNFSFRSIPISGSSLLRRLRVGEEPDVLQVLPRLGHGHGLLGIRSRTLLGADDISGRKLSTFKTFSHTTFKSLCVVLFLFLSYCRFFTLKIAHFKGLDNLRNYLWFLYLSFNLFIFTFNNCHNFCFITVVKKIRIVSLIF